jgi:hypothetical protein
MTHRDDGLLMLHCTLRSAAALLLGGVLMLSPLAANAEGEGSQQKPPDQAQGQQKPAPTPEEQKAIDQAKAAQSKAVAEYKEAAEKLTGTAGTPECVWTGRRVASLLWRDDIDTARRYIDLYDRFGCPSDHLKVVFRCIILQGPIDPKAADLASRVHACWIAPKQPTTASATTGATAKDGTIPN